jgi:succinate dehydrogenase/fumarate reductase flavoprotein subunit
VKDKKDIKMKTDIVIIGCGGSGLPAALTPHEKGSKVLVLEKRGVVGGNALMAEGFIAAESPAQKRLLIDAKKDDLFKTALDYAHYKIDPRILRAFINRWGDTMRWIEEKGIRFNRIALFIPTRSPWSGISSKVMAERLLRSLKGNARKKAFQYSVRQVPKRY